jgi:hypothetical protein
MKKLPPKGLDFLENPPDSLDFEAEINCSAMHLFEALADIEQLPSWLDEYKGASWLTDAPFGLGSLREVRLKTLTVHERFVAWDPGKRISFTMEGITLPIVSALGEDMRIEAIDDSHCRLKWRVAYELVFLVRIFNPLVRWNFGKLFRKSLDRLKKHVERK